jgi:hypothetical protein
VFQKALGGGVAGELPPVVVDGKVVAEEEAW